MYLIVINQIINYNNYKLVVLNTFLNVINKENIKCIG